VNARTSQHRRRPRLVALPSPTLARTDDVTLTVAAAGGDPQAAALLWDRFSPMVRRLLQRTLGPHRNVEDLLQRVFLRLLRRERAVRGVRDAHGLFVAVTVRVLVSDLRRRSAARLLFGVKREPESSTSRMDLPEMLAALYDILDGLTPRTRVAFVLRYFEGMRPGEISRALALSNKNVERRLAKAARHVLGLARPDWWLGPHLAEAEPAGNLP